MNKMISCNSLIQNKQLSNFTICIAQTPEERQDIFRLRYQVYVHELGRQLHDVNHTNQMLVDGMDDTSILLYLRFDNSIIGTLRLHIGPIDFFPQEISQAFQMKKFQTIMRSQCRSEFAFSSKLAVHTDFRRSPAVYMLLARGYELFRDRSIAFNFCGCAPYMLSFYEQLGFRRYSENFTVPDYGYMVPLVMIPEDADYLRTARSPLFRIAQSKPSCHQISQAFLEKFPAARSLVNSRIAKSKGILQYIQSCNLRLDRVSLFHGLSAKQIEMVLAYCVIITCQINDVLTHPTDIGNEVFLVLTGLLQRTYTTTSQHSTLKPGQAFGGNALLEAQRIRGYRIQALSQSDLLILSTQQFINLSSRHPEIGNLLSRNAATQL